MADVTKNGNMTIVAAADIADIAHPINTTTGSQYNDQAGIGKVPGRMYLRDNGASDYDIVIPTGTAPAAPWILIESGTNVVAA